MDKLATWKVRPNQYAEWQCLHKEYPRDQTYGCEFNTLAYLNSLPRDVGEYLTRDTNLKPVKEAATQTGCRLLWKKCRRDFETQ